MRVSIQWATVPPKDWIDYDLNTRADIRTLPRKPVPVGDEVLDDQPGWLCALDVQGVLFSGYDFIAIDLLPSGELRVAGWFDDLEEDWQRDGRWMTVWRFPADPADNLRSENAQSRDVYAETAAKVQADGGKTRRQWANRPLWRDDQTLYGIWLSDELFQDHVQIRSYRGLTDWLP